MRFFSSLKIAIIIFSFLLKATPIIAQLQEENFTIESYYKVKWGYANEFIDLWKKNHLPLLKKAREKGDIVTIIAEKPMMHSSEDSRWDFKVAVTYKNSSLGLSHGLTDAYKKQLYPDLDRLAKDEQHRFELLLAHWDVMTEKVDLSK